VAAEVGVAEATVGKWRSRFIEKRLKGLSDEYRSGAPHSGRGWMAVREGTRSVLRLRLQTVSYGGAPTNSANPTVPVVS